MHKCGHLDEQEKCPKYQPKCDKPGKVNLVCLWYRKDYLGCEKNDSGSICTKSINSGVTGVYK